MPDENVSPVSNAAPSPSIPLPSGETVIGRGTDVDIQLAHPEVSRRHCLIHVHDGRVEIEDLGGRGGTLINGQRFDRAELIAGDRIRVGPFGFRFDGSELIAAGDGATVVFNDVGVIAGGRRILENISCTIPAGLFAGILGPSGAGKSTLIRCAAGLRPPDDGNVVFEGDAATQGYVPQDDIVHSRLTPHQALTFAARLRLRRDIPRNRIDQIVRRTLEMLRLEQRAGIQIDKLSGGQRKRVSVATELLARPSVLFLDEPTSGLDPAAELRLMEVLRRLATSGCTVLCTTHIVENVFLMDRLLVLGNGRLVFDGTPDGTRAHFGVSRFQEIYERLDAPSQESPAATDTSRGHPGPQRRSNRGESSNGFFGTFSILLARMTTLLAAEPRQLLLLFLQPLLIAFLLGWASNDAALILFFAGIAAIWFGCNNASEEIVKETSIYLRERFAGVSRAAYVGSKFVWMSAVTLVQATLLYCVCQLLERGLPGDWRWQILALALSAITGTAIGLAVSALARSARQAILAVPLLLIPQILLSGYTIPAFEMTPVVRRVASFLPSYATQQIFDTSFVWEKSLSRDVLKDYWTSFRNLNENGKLKTGEIYKHPATALTGCGIHALWIILAIAGVWTGLAKREKLGA